MDRTLTADEAVEVIVTGNHAQATQGNLEVDGTMIELVRAGFIVCSLDENNILLLQATPIGRAIAVEMGLGA